MSIFNKDKSENKKQPENTTKPKSNGDKITAVQWVKNSGHSLKGLFLEWLSEQELFSIVGGEIKAVKKSMKKKKLSPKENKTLKQKLADLSEGAIAKFGKDYLGQDSPEETKEYIKDGLNTIMKQVKTGNFHEKDNLFGDDEEMNAFMDQLEDEWDEDEDYEASEESFSYKDLVAKYNKGFGEFISAKDMKKHKSTPRKTSSKIKDVHFEDYGHSDGKYGEYFISDKYYDGLGQGQFTIYVDVKGIDDITDSQLKIYNRLLNPDKSLKDAVEKVRKSILGTDKIDYDEDRKYASITQVEKLENVYIRQDGSIDVTFWVDFFDKQFEDEYEAETLKLPLELKTSSESTVIVSDELSPVGESYDENKMLYNMRKNIFD